MSAGAAAGLLSASTALGAVIPRQAAEKRLCFYNAHTGERLDVCYCKDGYYLPEALLQINYILRDFRTGEVQPIDPRLLDTLHHLSRKVSRRCTFHIVSGYRSPATNALLRRKSRGVAKNSYHMYGKAIDIFVPGYRLSRLRRLALSLKAGGVGYYPKTGFVHLDVGPVRQW